MKRSLRSGPMAIVFGVAVLIEGLSPAAVLAGGFHKHHGPVAVAPVYMVPTTSVMMTSGVATTGTLQVSGTNTVGTATPPLFAPVATSFAVPAFTYTVSAPSAPVYFVQQQATTAVAPLAPTTFLGSMAPAASNAFLGSGQTNPVSAATPPGDTSTRTQRILQGLRNALGGRTGDRSTLFTALLNEGIRLFQAEVGGFLPNDADHKILQDLVNRVLDESKGGGVAPGSGGGQGPTQVILQGPFNLTIPNATFQVSGASFLNPGPSRTGGNPTGGAEPPEGAVVPPPVPSPATPGPNR